MKKSTNLIRIFAMMLVLLGASSNAFGAYYMKHPWGGGNWEYKQLDGNNQITAAYGGNGVNIAESSSGANEQWFSDPKLEGNPTTGTQCVFKYDPSTNTVTITATSTPTPSASGMFVIGAGVGDDKWENFKPMTKGSNGEYYYEGVLAERQFKFTTQNNWSEASQSLYNQSGEDTTKSVGVNLEKKGNDNNLQITFKQGYANPITFYVNSSTKKYWAIATKAIKFDLTASANDYDTENAPAELTLKVDTDNSTTGDFTWYQSTDGTNYTEITGVTGNTCTLTGDNVPMITTYFKVKRQKTGSAEFLETSMPIYVFQICADGTETTNLFSITFDDDNKLKSLLGAGSRMEYDGMVTDYKYVEAPYKINDGQYAIVTEPLYCGYGEGNQEECGTDIGCIEKRIKEDVNGRWFRGFRDHTQNKGGANPPFGGMLLINFDKIDATNEESGVAFSRILTADETKNFTEGAILTFTAYMASAAVKEKKDNEGNYLNFQPIDAELRIQFQATGSTSWVTLGRIFSQVAYDDNWKEFKTSFKIFSTEGQFRVVIKNNGSTGVGNDLLIDDISLDLCSPTISLEYENTNKLDYTFTRVDEEVTVRVPKVNFGSIDKPCLMLFGIDPEGKYSYIADMEEDGNYYVAKNIVNASMLIEIKDDGSRNIKPLKLQAVISEQVNGQCSERVRTAVENGDLYPGKDPMVVFSNTLTANLECLESQLVIVEGEPTSICYSKTMILPELKLTSDNIASAVSLDILVNEEVVLEGVPFIPEEGSENVMLLNISQMYEEANGTPYLPAVGDQKITIKITENYADGVICERLAKGDVTIKVTGKADKPVLIQDGDRYAYNMCKTKGADSLKVDDKFFFNDLVAQPTDKSTLVWLTKDNQPIAKEDAFLYADTVHVDSVKVFNYPSDGCPSDTVLVRYRVKAITPKPVFTKDYNECALGESAELIELKSLIDVEKSFEKFDEPGITKAYKYIDFINQDTKQVETTFDPRVPGTRKYTVNVSLDETNSASNNFCESSAEYTVKVKDYAKKINILAQDTAVCSIDSLILLADTEFATAQTNVTINWYSDNEYSRKLGVGKTFSYFLVADPNTQYPYTLYLTVQSDDYCENIPSEAKPVTITLKEQAPSLLIEPKEQTISVGGVPSFTLSPAGEQRYSLYVNDKKVDKTIEEFKPYIDSEYKVVYEGECGSSYDSARVEVQWPTVFTPHVKDGRNDTFVKDMDPNFYTKIFTRYGTKIYESPNGWDGSVGGSMNGRGDVAVPGVYYYVVDLPDGNVKKGTIEVFKY